MMTNQNTRREYNKSKMWESRRSHSYLKKQVRVAGIQNGGGRHEPF